MPTRPTASPLFATDPTLTGGPQVGQTVRFDPGSAARAQGFYEGRRMPGRAFSYLLGVIGDWLSFFDNSLGETQANNWPERSSITNSTPVNSDIPIAYDAAPSTQGYNSSGVLIVASFSATQSYSSADGRVWTVGASFGGFLGSSAFDMAVGVVGGVSATLVSGTGTGNLAKSTDGGATWSLVGTVIGNSSVLRYNGTIWTAHSTTSPIIYSSTDGITWTSLFGAVPSTWFSGGYGARRVIANLAGVFVAIHLSTYNKVLTSADGVTWVERTLPVFGHWVGVAYSESLGLWMVVDSGGLVCISSNLTTWTQVATTTLLTANDLAVNRGVWVAVTGSGVGGGIKWSSDAGVTWKSVSVSDHRVATSGFVRVIFADNRFIAVHATGSAIEFSMSLRTN